MEYFTEKLRNLISDNVEIADDFAFEQFKVGRSNITYKIYDDNNVYVLRRPPFGPKLESAHNMEREFRIISSLYKNKIRVPKPEYIYTEKKISDDDFYIMEFIKGETISDNLIAKNFDEIQKKDITESFIEALVEIHMFDVVNSELTSLGMHENYIERQLVRWSKQFDAQKVREINELNQATKMLFENIPNQQRVSIVHGDYRLDNVRVDNSRVKAVVDWELCTLGDPLADLGTIIASWSSKEETDTPFIYSPSLAGGFPSRSQILEQYESLSKLNILDIEFYTRMSFWKHAMIMEGVYVRYSLGYYGDVEDSKIEAFKESTISFAKKASSKNLLGEML